MNLSNIETSVRYITKTDATSFPDADILREANTEYGKWIMRLVAASDHKNELGGHAYTNLKNVDSLSEGDNGYNGEYALPSDCLVVKRIEVKYDDDQEPVTLYDMVSYNHSEFDSDDISENFSQTNPKMRFLRDSILLRPLPDQDVTKGLYIEFLKRQTDIADDSSIIYFEENFHDLIVLGVARRYMTRNPEKYNPKVEKEYQELKDEFNVFYEDRFSKPLRIKTIKEQY